MMLNVDNSKAAIIVPGILKILRRWQCSTQVGSVLLGFENEALFQLMLSEPRTYNFTAEHIERMSYLLNIYRSLRTIFTEEARSDNWLNVPNSNVLFGGQPAIDVMKKGKVSDLALVAGYLQAQY